jgi:hypothetical protein
VLRDCLSGEVLLARSLLSACEADLAKLLREVQQELEVPIGGDLGWATFYPQSCTSGVARCFPSIVPFPLRTGSSKTGV